MSWYDPTSWFDDAPLDSDVTAQAAAAGFTSQAEYEQYILDQSQQALYLAGGGGADQAALGAGIVQESIGQYTVQQTLASLPANIAPASAPYFYSSGGTLGDVLADTRSGLQATRQTLGLVQEIRNLSQDTASDAYQIGTGRDAVTVLPRRTTGSGQPGTLAGPSTGWGAAVNEVAANPQQLVLSVAVGGLIAFAAKRLLRAA
jgi:hypothetical protein